MAITAERTIPADGTPADTLPTWGTTVRADGVTLILHPPIDFELAYRVPQAVVVFGYSSALTDGTFGDEPARRLRLRANGAIVVPPDTCVRVRQREPLELLVLAVEPEHLAALAARLGAARLQPHILLNASDPGVTALAHEIRRALLADPVTAPAYLGALADALLTRLLARFVAEAAAPAPDALAPAALRRILLHIEAHLDEPIRVDDLARMAGLSRAHFTRAFATTTGEPPARFVLKRRICRARDLISAGEALSAVAAKAGFSSQAHLSTCFRKELGVSPGRYREAWGGPPDPG